jgi:hypothetical protein
VYSSSSIAGMYIKLLTQDALCSTYILAQYRVYHNNAVFKINNCSRMEIVFLF